MKKLYRLVFQSFISSFAVTFCIAVFVFLMIFIFVYIDDFVGKNIGVFTLSKLFFFFSLNTITKALPLAILLSSIMSIGNMAENYEITAMKSAGISFYKVTRPILVFSMLMAVFLFSFSNFILPSINYKLQTILLSVRSSKPELLFKEGVFNNEMTGFSIRIGKIDKDGHTFRDILIYDHSEFLGNTTVLSAETGYIEKLKDSETLLFTLKHGSSYKEITDSSGVLENNDFIRDKFEERTIRFNLAEFMLRSVGEKSLRNSYDILNMSQMSNYMDSLRAENIVLGAQLQTSAIKTKIGINEGIILKYGIEWHKRIAIAFSCLLLFFIGAPIGYVIKKGGLGMPIVVSVIIYILYHTISITGEKLAEDESISQVLGIWMSTMIILPVGLFLFYKAAKDQIEFNFEWRNIFKRK